MGTGLRVRFIQETKVEKSVFPRHVTVNGTWTQPMKDIFFFLVLIL